MWLLYEDFIYLLREQFDRWPWWITTDGEIRTERMDGEELDPLTAMCATIHHRFVDAGNYRIAARYLGIDDDTADAIAAASDRAGSYNAHVRADLIDALHMEEMWAPQGRWQDRAFTESPYPHQFDRPLRHGSGSGGFASDAWRKALSKSTPAVPSAVWPWRLTANTDAPGVAVSIGFGYAALPPASSSSFSVGVCCPGFALYYERCAAD